MLAEQVPEDEFGMFKYLVDIDGNSYSRRMPRLLALKSVVVRIALFEDTFLRALVVRIRSIMFIFTAIVVVSLYRNFHDI